MTIKQKAKRLILNNNALIILALLVLFGVFFVDYFTRAQNLVNIVVEISLYGVIHGVALQAADVQRIVQHIASAAGLAGMLAYIRAGRGEGVVLSNEPHGIGAAVVADKRYVARNIHARRT